MKIITRKKIAVVLLGLIVGIGSAFADTVCSCPEGEMKVRIGSDGSIEMYCTKGSMKCSTVGIGGE